MTRRRAFEAGVLWYFLVLAGCGGISAATGALPRGYQHLFSPAPHAFGYVSTPDPLRRGNRAERYELRDVRLREVAGLPPVD